MGVLGAKGRKMGVLGGKGRIRQFVFAAGPSTRRYKVALVESSNAQIIGGAIFTAWYNVEEMSTITALCCGTKHKALEPLLV